MNIPVSTPEEIHGIDEKGEKAVVELFSCVGAPVEEVEVKST